MVMRVLIAVVLLLGPAAVFGSEQPDSGLVTAVEVSTPDSIETGQEQLGTVIAYYFHGNRRCATCQKLEAYSEEAIAEGFAERLADSSLIWRVVNFESDGNEHFAKDYQLYSQSVILSRVVDGEEAAWVNLDKIWQLVGDKESFLSYIRKETRAFLEPSAE